MDTKKINLIFIVLLFVLAIGYIYKNKQHESPQTSLLPITEPITEPEQKVEIPTPEIHPEFHIYPQLRDVENPTLGKVLRDIESHMPFGHPYTSRNKITWAHETTHGINSAIRNGYPNPAGVNGFYCLENRACVLYEPKTTIRVIADQIPEVLRGPSYQLYLVQQAREWNNRPLYLFDEWVAYTNGAATGRELNYQGWYYELLQVHNFNVYCIYMAMTVKTVCPDYDDAQMKLFMKWNIERTFALTNVDMFENRKIMAADIEEVGLNHSYFHLHLRDLHKNKYGGDNNPLEEAMQYIELVRTAPKAEGLRMFCRDYFGVAWCKRVYGF